jgi:lipopolysaccharide biosynthesis glycosyltransferase
VSGRVHVALAADRRCVQGCAVSIRSMAENAAGDARLAVHLIANGLTAEQTDLLRRTIADAAPDADVSLYQFDPGAVAHLLRSSLITHTAYALLYLGELLPPSVTRCIYLDCDLAFERDITELWRTDLCGLTMGAVDNGSWQDSGLHQRRLGLREPRYFNSGVLLIDLGRWRTRDVGQRAVRAAAELGDRLILHDQDALNHALQDDWLAIPAHWNVWTIRPGLRADERAVFHYMGGPKPWDADYDRPFQEKFLAYLDRTPLSGWRPWNPAGIGSRLARLRRRTPYLPAVFRALRRSVPALSRHS